MAGLTVEQDTRVRSALADLHDKFFTRDLHVTLVARHPTEAERHLVCGDDWAAVAKLVRSKLERPTGEQLAKLYRIQALNSEDGTEGTREALERCAKMIVIYAPDAFPANDLGQIHFGRALMESVADETRAHLDSTAAISSELAKVLAERDKLQRFKEYVHRRLDEAGVPTDPESSHRAEGCRIGGRLDIVLADRITTNAICFNCGGPPGHTGPCAVTLHTEQGDSQ